MTRLRFYEHFAAAYGTIWLVLMLGAVLTQRQINTGEFGLIGFPILALIYAFYRRNAAEAVPPTLPVREIQRSTGLCYPDTFYEHLAEFSSQLAAGVFERSFPGAKLLRSVSEVTSARRGIPDNLLPFMVCEHPGFADIYAFDPTSRLSSERVVVWCAHAIVEDWPTFRSFLEWMNEQRTVTHS